MISGLGWANDFRICPARPLAAAAGDVRELPFCDASFDAIYSMGTIEHFAETERAVSEMARVLSPW